MDAETTKMMQDALQATVARMNSNGSGEPRAANIDTIATLMQFAPKLLNSLSASGQMIEKMDALQKGDITSMRGDVEVLRKQCHRLLKSQEQVLEKVGELQAQQTAVAQAVLDLAHQMARITFIEDIVDDDGEGIDDGDEDAEFATNGARMRHRAART